ncbi:MAG: hypothetical protein AVDCRST_MAG38-810, partial [uncultured Solirubrobacteraceae bacterium]
GHRPRHRGVERFRRPHGARARARRAQRLRRHARDDGPQRSGGVRARRGGGGRWSRPSRGRARRRRRRLGGRGGRARPRRAPTARC